MPSAAFFASVRASLFGGSIPQSAVDTITILEAQWIASQATSLDQFAYVLATDFNELGVNMKPVEENLSYSADRAHQVWPNKFPTVAAAAPYAHNPQKLGNHVYANIDGNGNEASGDGYRFRGRGASQLTGRTNYANFSQIIGVDLVANPDLVMDPATGAKILITGMLEGLFTGKKLSDYFTASKQDATHARAIVNGDVATNGAKIAGYWRSFRTAMNLVDPKIAVPPKPTESAADVLKSSPLTPVGTIFSTLETVKMNISLLTLIISHLDLLSYLQQDVTTEVKVLSSSESGSAKVDTTIAVLEDLLAQVKAVKNGTPIPPVTAK